MKLHWLLRLEAMWSLLRGTANSLSVANDLSGPVYRIDLPASAIRRWRGRVQGKRRIRQAMASMTEKEENDG